MQTFSGRLEPITFTRSQTFRLGSPDTAGAALGSAAARVRAVGVVAGVVAQLARTQPRIATIRGLWRDMHGAS